jgi:uncharacterized protein (DUF58 family)
VLVGLASQQGAVVVLGFVLALICGGALLWSRWALRRLVYERVIPENRAFPGEEIAVTLRITNGKPLPLSWIEVRDTFPEAMTGGVAADDFYSIGQPDRVGFDWRTSVGAHQKVSRAFGLRAPERGVYKLGPATLRSGDPLGMFPEERTDEPSDRIIVYPRTVDLGETLLPSRRPYGDSRGGLRVYEDPSRIAGLRDYQPSDPLRRIDWNATARLGKLQSRVYDPSSSRHLLVCLNTATMAPAWAGYIPELFERSITVAASLAREANEQRYAVGLLATSSVADADSAIRIPPGRRTEQLMRVLEALAVVTPFVLDSMSRMLDREEHRLAVGTTLVVVTATMPEDLAISVLRLRRRGHSISVLSTSGDLWPDLLPGIDVLDLSGIDELKHRDTEAQRLGGIVEEAASSI